MSVIVVACNKIDCDPIEELQQEKVLSFTELQTKYVDNLLTYEFSKKDRISIRSSVKSVLDLNAMTLNEKLELVMQLNEIKNAPTLRAATDEIESPEDEAFYLAQCESLLAELNAHPLVIAELQKEGVVSEPDDMIYYIGTQAYNKFDILRQAEIKTEESQELGKIQLRAARLNPSICWPTAPKTIDYRFENNVSTNTKTGIAVAMKEWETAANKRIKFNEIPNSTWNQLMWTIICSWHICIKESNSAENGSSFGFGYCFWSTITLPQPKPGISYSTTYLHELGHILGLIHEHQRSDRDNFVVVNLNNVKTTVLLDYIKLPSVVYGEFDFNSIMMYGSLAGSIDGIKPCMTKKNDGSTWERKYVLSDLDKAKIKEIYK